MAGDEPVGDIGIGNKCTTEDGKVGLAALQLGGQNVAHIYLVGA